MLQHKFFHEIQVKNSSIWPLGNNEASAVKMASQPRVLQGRNVKMDK